ncbi:MAG: hypothetical protein WBX20_13670, partial [Terrimicrobiaceae bacterium]
IVKTGGNVRIINVESGKMSFSNRGKCQNGPGEMSEWKRASRVKRQDRQGKTSGFRHFWRYIYKTG